MCLLYNKAVVVARCVYVVCTTYMYYIYMHSARMYNTYIEKRKYKWAWLITFRSISIIFTTNFLDKTEKNRENMDIFSALEVLNASPVCVHIIA